MLSFLLLSFIYLSLVAAVAPCYNELSFLCLMSAMDVGRPPHDHHHSQLHCGTRKNLSQIATDDNDGNDNDDDDDTDDAGSLGFAGIC